MVMYLAMMDSAEDQSKFETLYLTYRGLMYTVAYGIVKNKEDAEDIVHSAFEKIAGNMEKVEEAVCPKTKAYIVTITERKAIDLYRRKQRHPEAEFNEETVGLEVDPANAHTIAHCFARLPKRYRHGLLLKYRYGYDTREIAKLMEISEANAAKLLQRARGKFDALCKEENLL